MYSRAHLLIERAFRRLNEDRPWGIEAEPVAEDGLFDWVVKISGPKDTNWQGGIFRLHMKFQESYHATPPDICFHTIPFHPNVDMNTGRPCVDFLDDLHQWHEDYSLSNVLLSIQTMLGCPVLESAVNPEASTMLIHNPAAYAQVVQDCVTASRRVDAGLDPYTKQDHAVTFTQDTHTKGQEVEGHRRKSQDERVRERGVPRRRPMAKISFEDYHNTWSGIATSKWAPEASNPLLEAIRDNPALQATHFGLPAHELQLQIDKQMEDHSTLMYGKFKAKPQEVDPQKAKLDHVNKMKKIYLQPRSSRKTPNTALSSEVIDIISRSNTFIEDGENMTSNKKKTPEKADDKPQKENSSEARAADDNIGDDVKEQDVDALVSWTKQLDEQAL